LYTGTGSGSKTVTGVGFRPDLVWGRSRTGSIGNILFDVVRGENKQLSSDNTSAEVTRSSAAYEFENDGFTVTTAGNLNNSVNYVAWNWKAGGALSINTDGAITSLVSANQAAGFSIVNWSGNGSNDTIGHGLSAAPEMIIYKSISATQNWTVLTTAIDGSADGLVLNDTSVKFNIGAAGATPTSTVFGNVGFPSNMIAYCFKSISGYSKVGTYTGTGVAGEAGSLVNVGFLPQFVVVKRTDAVNSWVVSSTLLGYNDLYWNLSDAQFASGTLYGAHYTSSGFFFNTADGSRNASGATYIYMAIA
jgi:hypothetical protein